MSAEIISLKCPDCGAPVSMSMEECEYCGNPIAIKSYDAVKDMTPLQVNKQVNAYRQAMVQNPDDQGLNMAAAFCFLKLKLYDKALPCFEKAMADNFDNPEPFFYAAVCLLKGKKAFLTPRAVIDKAEEYINAALMIEPRAIFYYFWAYLRYDHHFRKSYRVNPNYQALFTEAKQAGLTINDVKNLYAVLGVERPTCL